jgi:hypothetical protein
MGEWRLRAVKIEVTCMLATVVLLATFWTGWNLVKSLPAQWYKLEFWCLAYVAGLLSTTWWMFVASLVVGYGWGVPIGLVLTVASSEAIFRFARRKLTHTATTAEKQTSRWLSLASVKSRAVLTAYTLSWALVFTVLFQHHSFSKQPDGWYSGGNTWADLALHSTLIYSFAESPQPVLQFPIYPQAALTYPFLFDFYTAMLLRGGFSIQLALVVTSILSIMSLLILMYFFVWRITRSSFIAAASGSLFVLNSNIGSWLFLRDWWASGQTLAAFTRNLPDSYVHFEEKGLYWTQVTIDLLLPQRGILVGMSVFFAFCLVLFLLTQLGTKKISGTAQSEHENKSLNFSPEASIFRYSFAFLLGLLPFFHIHSFLVLVGVFGMLLCCQLYHAEFSVTKFAKAWLKPLLLLGILAAPQLAWQFGKTAANFLSFHWGWQSGESNLVVFWLRNLGLELPLAVVGIGYLFYSKAAPWLLKFLTIPLIALFILCNMFSFQPNIWDNTKFMVYSHWLMIVVGVWALHMAWQVAQKMNQAIKQLTSAVVIVAILILGSGGVIALTRELQLNWQSVNTEGLAVAEFVRENTQPDAVFLTADTHNHPIPMLTGRPIVMGYAGWLWTYGIRYLAVKRDVVSIYSGEAQAEELLKKHQVQYIYVGPQEAELGANLGFLNQFPKIYQSERVSIYKVGQ